MPIHMVGSPNSKPHWKDVQEEAYFGHSPIKTLRQKREEDFQKRQKERVRQEEVHAAYEKEKRLEMSNRLEKRLEFAPGYGPTKWLWPTAYEHPRSYVPGGDILLEFGSVVHQHGGKGTGIVIGNPASYSSVEPGSFPSPSASDGYPSP